MLQFISFGSGSSGNSCLLFTENEGLLIDAGIGVRTLRKHLREYGIPLSKINNILITHDHADHVMSVGSLSRDFQLPVYTTEKVHKGIYGNWCVKHKIAQSLQKVIEKGQTFRLGDFALPYKTQSIPIHLFHITDHSILLQEENGDCEYIKPFREKNMKKDVLKQNMGR